MKNDTDGKTRKDECEWLKRLSLLQANNPDAFNDNEYEAKILDYEIRNKKVRNIAIIGKHGSGKSSLILKYLNDFRLKKRQMNHNDNKKAEKGKYAIVSLLTFKDESQTSSIGLDKENDDNIERRILEQLLYSKKNKKLPNSRIKRTNKSSIFLIHLFAIMFSIGIFLIPIVIIILKKLVENGLFSDFIYNIILLAISIVYSIFVASCIIYAIRNKKFSKIKYRDLELEEDKEKKNTSLIDLYVDEIIYFFECSKIDLVIFEDLDRFKDDTIFIKLRELNIILNNSCKSTKKITFLYSIDGNILSEANDKSKFFDFCLYLPAVLNVENIKAKITDFNKSLEDTIPGMGVSTKLINCISPFIDDMRTMHNIFNDFIISYKYIHDNDHCFQTYSNDKLFVISCYKNLFSSDYNKLENKKGLLRDLINENYAKKKFIGDLNDEIRKMEKRIEDVQSSTGDFEDLKAQFIYQLSNMPSSNYPYGITNPWEIKSFKGLEKSYCCHPKNTNSKINSLIGEIKHKSGKTYIEMEELIELKKNKGLKELKDELSKKKKTTNEYLSMSLYEIVEEKGVDFVIDKELVSNIQKNTDKDIDYEYLIKFVKIMLSNDLIDEHYYKYIYSVNSNSLSENDLSIIQNIQTNFFEYDVQSDNYLAIYDYLDLDYFRNESIVIKPFLDHLTEIKEKSKEPDKFSLLINSIVKLNDNHRELVFVIDSQIEEIMKYVVDTEPNYINVLVKLNIDFSVLYLALRLTLKYLKDKEKSDFSSRVIEIMTTPNDYLSLFDGMSLSDVKYLLDKYNCKFKTLCHKEENDVQKLIINNNNYEINIDNLIEILNRGDEEFYSLNYSLVKTRKKVFDYIQTNISDYVNNILFDDRISFNLENEKSILELINNVNITLEIKRDLIKKIAQYERKFKAKDITEKDILSICWIEGIIKNSWDNYLNVYNVLEFDAFMSKMNKVDLKNSDNDIKENDERYLSFVKKLVSIRNDSEIGKIINSLPFQIKLRILFETQGANYDTIFLYIKDKKILPSIDDINPLRDRTEHVNEYIICYEEFVLSNKDLFFSTYLSTNQSNKLRGLITNTRISYEIKRFILNTYWNIVDISWIDNDILKTIINNCDEINKNLLWKLGTINDESLKIKLLISQDKQIDIVNDKVNLVNYVKNINDEWKILGERLTIADSSDNRKLCELLKEKNIIRSYSPNFPKKRITVYF